jgi:anti-sigma factor RsiW
MMHETTNAPTCAHADELVTYLYGEASEIEAQAFENHMQRCAACRTELMAFGEVRQSVGAWRAESLGAFAPSVLATTTLASLPLHQTVKPARASQRSFFDALRDFLTLSPISTRGAVAFASVLLCALIVFAVARFSETPKMASVVKSAQANYSQQSVEAVAKIDGQDNEAGFSKVSNSDDGSTIPSATIASTGKTEKIKSRNVNASSSITIANNKPRKRFAQPFSREERQQLAEVFQLNGVHDDEDLPSLSDLVNDSSRSGNQH